MHSLHFRTATLSDLPAIIALLADDELGRQREVIADPVDNRYLAAFGAIAADTNQRLVVAEQDGQRSEGAGRNYRGWRHPDRFDPAGMNMGAGEAHGAGGLNKESAFAAV